MSIRTGVQFGPEPSHFFHDTCANFRCIFSNSRCENEAIDTSDGSGEHSGVKPAPVNKMIDCQTGSAIVTVQKDAHVSGDS